MFSGQRTPAIHSFCLHFSQHWFDNYMVAISYSNDILTLVLGVYLGSEASVCFEGTQMGIDALSM